MTIQWPWIAAAACMAAMYYLPKWWAYVPNLLKLRLPWKGEYIGKLSDFVASYLSESAPDYDDAASALRVLGRYDPTLKPDLSAMLDKLLVKRNADEKARLLGGEK